jgi:nucleotidyltransferase substrate binding protein (TIGR01987 family)
MEDFSQALKRLDKVLQRGENEFIRDSAIKRFEIVFDLGWNTLKKFLQETHNTSCVSPITCFREVLKKGVIDHDTFWIEVKETRNLTVHAYNKNSDEKVYRALPETLIHFRSLYEATKRSNS